MMIAKISFAVAVAATSLSALAAAPVYRIELIPRTGNLVPLCGLAINNAGEVMGAAYDAANSNEGHVFKYADGIVTFMPEGAGVNPRDMNAAGDVLTTSNGSSVWRASGVVEKISEEQLNAMNDRNEFVGNGYQSGQMRGLFFKDGAITDLGTLGGSTSTASDINNAGQATGGAALPGDEVIHAFIWKDGVMKDIGTLYENSWGSAINAKGHVVGDTYGPEDADAFLFDGTSMKPLPRLKGKMSTPLALNVHDEVVGHTISDATLYRKGRTYQLKKLLDSSGSGWKQLRAAFDINDRSQIVGCGNYRGENRAYVATRVSP